MNAIVTEMATIWRMLVEVVRLQLFASGSFMHQHDTRAAS